MNDFVFTSPGVKFKERDLSFVTRNVGITTLGLVGETIKGPAFEPVFLRDKGEFSDKFGGQSIKRFGNGSLKYELPYVANAYLEETNQLWVTRVLGLSGYDAGNAWVLTLNAGVDPTTVGDTTDVETIENIPFSGFTYLGYTLNYEDDTGSVFTGFTKTSDNTFEGERHEFTATTLNQETGEGEVTDVVTKVSGTSYTEYENMVLAVIRSRGYVQDVVNEKPLTIFETDSLSVLANSTNIGVGDMFETFTLRASNTENPNDEPQDYVVSLDPNSSSFLPNVIGRTPKDKDTRIWVESVYPDLIKKLDGEDIGYGINDALIKTTTNAFSDYKSQFTTPKTPWIVSQLNGNNVDKLFRFHTISDGNSANREIKISLTNINPITLEFDVIVRDWADSDANLTIIESFTRCSLIKTQTNFIGRRIGTIDGEYDLKSQYIILELAENIEPTLFPAGFEGYKFKDYSGTTTGDETTNGITPKIYYKTKYEDDERPRGVFLGVSELAYSTDTSIGKGINQNFFNFNGLSGFANTKGFHLDIEATGKYNNFEYETGEGKFQTIDDIMDENNAYFEIETRKFTLVPAGGFDGWNVHRESRSNNDGFQLNGIFDGVVTNGNPMNDFQAWETAINTFANPEEVSINLFATPGINWGDNTTLVKNTIEMIENERTDSLYIIDSPNIDIPQVVGENKADVLASKDIVGLLDSADIDSNYVCTYFPWIQIRDGQNNVNLYIPPTGEVTRAMAFTDNSSYPWFAPAGLNRGTINAKKSKYKLSLGARDVLYTGRINPIADFADVGTAIFGQKTLQKKESALDRINVRRLLLQIKVLISNIAIRLVFDQNDDTTIDEFLSKSTPVLDTIKRERGLQEFRIKMDETVNTTETMDRNELFGEIFLKPTRTVEFIGIKFTITPSGAAFEDFGG